MTVLEIEATHFGYTSRRFEGDVRVVSQTSQGSLHVDYETDVSEREVVIRVHPVTGELVETRRDQSWFWTSEWQAKEREADEALAEGRARTFDNMDDMIAFLDAQ